MALLGVAICTTAKYCEASGSTYDSRPDLIQPERQSFLAFDRVPLDQLQVRLPRPAETHMYIPISLGGILMILLVVWLLRG